MLKEPRPACPITGGPAEARIQWLDTRALARLWRYAAGVDVARLFEGTRRLGLWRSSCGLAFFDPPVEGDSAFYDTFYGRWKLHQQFRATAAERQDLLYGARHVRRGDRVLDVGSGSGAFASHIPHADYTGIDAHAEGSLIRREPLGEHVAANLEAYDVVCAFQVIEHTPDPLEFARRMLAALKPGGLLIIAAPLWPSPMTDVPNYPINFPPHHLTWWTEEAFRALARVLRLEVVGIAALAPYSLEDTIQWMSRLSPVKARSRFFAHRLSWHASLGFAFAAGTIARKLFGRPRDARPIDIVLVARKARE